MPRSTGGPTHSRKRKRVLNAASGFRAASGTLYRPALEFVRKAGVYAYRDRRQRKRHFRSLWITRLARRYGREAFIIIDSSPRSSPLASN